MSPSTVNTNTNSTSRAQLSRQESLLISYLVERVFAEEWHKTLTAKYTSYTLVPYKALPSKRRPSTDSGYQTFDERAIFWSLAKRIPLLKIFWDEDLVAKLAVSLDFDLLAFATFYGSNAYRVAMEEFGIAPQMMHDYRYAVNIKVAESQFSLSKRDKPSTVDPERAHKHDRLVRYWRAALTDALAAKAVFDNMPGNRKEKQWKILQDAPTFDDLHPAFKKMIYSVVKAVAQTLDNILVCTPDCT